VHIGILLGLFEEREDRGPGGGRGWDLYGIRREFVRIRGYRKALGAGNADAHQQKTREDDGRTMAHVFRLQFAGYCGSLRNARLALGFIGSSGIDFVRHSRLMYMHI